MKKFVAMLLTAFLFVFSGINAANALSITITLVGSPVITDNLIYQDYTIISPVAGPYKTTITPRAAYLVNTTDPNIKIPVGNCYAKSGSNTVQLANGVPALLAQGTDLINLTLAIPLRISVQNSGPLPAGTYTLQCDVVTETGLTIITYTTALTFTFTITPSQDITSITGNPTIQLTEADVFNSSANVNNTTDTIVNVTANTNWVLKLNTTSFGSSTGTLYYQITGVNGTVTNYNTNKITIQPNQNYTLASGTPTYTLPPSAIYTPTSLTIRYSYTNPAGSFPTEGTKINPITYSISQN